MKRAIYLLALGLLVAVAGIAPRGDGPEAGSPGCTITINTAMNNVSSGDSLVTLSEAVRFATDAAEPAGMETAQIAACPGDDDNPGAARADSILFDAAVFPGSSTFITIDPLCLCTGGDLLDGTGRGVLLLAADPSKDCISMVNSSGNEVRGVSIQNCRMGVSVAGEIDGVSGNIIRNNHFGGNQWGIRIANASDTIVEGNRIGTHPLDPNSAQPNDIGILIDTVANDPRKTSGNRIGGTTPAARNVISGNSSYGIALSEGADETLIQGNYIGTNVAGDAALPNLGSGIAIDGGEDVVVGGSTAGARNVISGNMGRGIDVGEDGVRIQGNYIGTNAAGTAAIPNGTSGIALTGAKDTLIGGASAAARNVISGNTFAGIDIQTSGTTDNTVQGNYIGTNAAGTAAIGNGQQGIIIDGAPGNLIGGSTGGTGNVLSGNNVGVLTVGSNASDNVIQGNRIGTNAAGTGPLGNANDGVQFVESGPNQLGGTGDGEGNEIAYNGDAGVVVLLLNSPSHRKEISRNSIHDNAGLGIDLENDGVTPNDDGTGDADDGGNGLQNFPVMTVAELSGDTLHVEGSLDSTPDTDFRIELFANGDCDPSGYGEGERFLGSFEASRGGGGISNLAADLQVEAMPGEALTATAIDEDNNTSEFSQCVSILGVATPTPPPTATPGPSVTPGPTHTPGPSVTPVPSETPGPDGLLGDTDCDNDVDSVDSLWVLREVVGLSFDAKCIAEGDVQCDGDRDSVDALGIQRHVAALPQIAQTEPCREIGT